ncbi:LysR substrate-binding domain-containing protein [Pseudomarimonas arenosa]|uniref:LysR family transcriptional regulator n=1 Tax=Pseudomarimonas arenosa TaxID=2774145 RepID=A0AAW3ZMH0_9GAMM|nr:LysR substrate-binding domain-containing protein [Pseudomarimonas arenosa]MBD8526729.1 LysR family transcriptional regulator [Pseudomarimonas arenosa]
MSLRPDWLPALAAFEAAARQQNFARAAEELHLTASAVSHHVRRLEARLGVALFQRHARGVSLTAEGRQLADAASDAFTDVEAALQGVRQRREREQTLRITTLHSLAHTWLLPRLSGFTAQFPYLGLVIDTEPALTRFDDGGPDLGIRHGPGQWPGLVSRYLMPDRLFAVASPARVAAEQTRQPADVLKLPLIADLARQGWSDWCRQARLTLPARAPSYTFSDSTDALEAAALGLGATLARESIVTPWIDQGRLQRLPGPMLEARWSYYVVYPQHRRLSPVAERFVEWLISETRPSSSGKV